MVVILDQMDDIRDGEHPNKDRFLAVPEGSGNDAWERKSAVVVGTRASRGCPPLRRRHWRAFLTSS
jgi:hypothetical protein